MKYWFKRFDSDKVNNTATHEMNLMNQQLTDNLYELRHGDPSEEEVRLFCQKAIMDGMPLNNNSELVFWGYTVPESMPSDARCEYFYLPSYLMVLTLVNAVLRFPKLIKMVGMKDALNRGLAGCEGRGLLGHGYDSEKELYKNLILFLKSGYCDFHLRYPELGQSFWKMFQRAVNHARDQHAKGHHANAWGESYLMEQENVLNLLPSWIDETYELEAGYQYNIAYGANMDVEKMKARCPDAELVGIGWITGMRIEFHKYATLMKTGNEEDLVPVALWRISQNDERRLDRYEGVPTFYSKHHANVTLNTGKEVRGLLYLMETIREERVNEEYYERLEASYRQLGQEEYIRSVLIPAKNRNVRNYDR